MRREWQGMRWLYSISDTMDINLSKALLLVFSRVFYVLAINQIKEAPQGWGSFTRPPSHNMHFWDRMAQGVLFQAIKQWTWIRVCWSIISPRFEKRKKKKEKLLILGRTGFINREGKKVFKKQKKSSACNLLPPTPWGPLVTLSFHPFLLGELCCLGKGVAFSFRNCLWADKGCHS